MRKLLPIVLATVLAAACASIGSPDGGAYDETPPRVVSASPANMATGARSKRITISFDEYIKIENASEKVVVSPQQREMPSVRASGKHVHITLYDTLRPNTTYTVDFADAIVDNNEGNPMGNFTYAFSTGESIDTMEVSGYVLDASNLEPVKGILVGLYAVEPDSVLSDSVLRQRPFDRVSRTNGSGRFVIKGVARGTRYAAYALLDADGDQVYSQPSEMMAWDTTTFASTAKPDIRLDTVWRDSTHYDSIVPVGYTHFRPDDIVLRAFKAGGAERHLLKQQRDVPETFTVYFTAPADSMPRIEGLSFEGDGGFTTVASAGMDTITYWITDTTLAYADTLSMVYHFLETDSTQQLTWSTDTFHLVPRKTRARILRELAEQTEQWEKEQRRKQKREGTMLTEENPYLSTYLTISSKPAGSIDPNQWPLLTFSEPTALPDSSAIHFAVKRDTLWVDTVFALVPTEGNPLQATLYADWQLGHTYQLTIDSAAMTSVMGHHNKAFRQEYKVRREEEYGALFVQVQTADTAIVVELLNASDKPVRSERADADGRADFFYLKPGDYYLRLYIDANGDGVWTTGDYDRQLQPEQVFYFPKAITVKANWEVEQQWAPRTIATHRQKPEKITKQKPDKARKKRNRNAEREQQRRRSR